MSAALPVLLVILAVAILVLAVLGWAAVTYNRLVKQRNQVQAAGAQVDVQLKRRHDLIPNLVRTVQGYAHHERATLEAVVAARQAAVAATGSSPAVRAAAEGELDRSLGRLLAVAEAYPLLKADQSFAALQHELSATEDKIAYSRQFLNSAVQTLNTSVESVPTNLVAGLGGFRRAEYVETTDGERGSVAVRF